LEGLDFSKSDLENIAREIYKLKYAFKKRESFSFKNLKIPERIYKTLTSVGSIDKQYMQDVINSVQEVVR